MTEGAALLIRDFYVKLRSRHREQCNVFQVTIRQLESLIRLASARARADLREEVSKQVFFAYEFIFYYIIRSCVRVLQLHLVEFLNEAVKLLMIGFIIR